MLLKRISCALLLFCSGLPPLLAADRLETPAVIRPLVEKSLLLSITQTDSRLIAVGEQGVIIYSDDLGNRWQQANVPLNVMLTGVRFSTKNTGWAVGHDGVVIKSDNQGQSWQKVLTGNDINQIRVSALEQLLNEGSSELTADQIEELEYKLDDALVAQEEGPTSPLLDILFTDAQHGYVIGAYGMMLQTQDGGQRWHYTGHKLPNPEGFHLNRIYQLKSGRLLILAEAGLLLASDDQGENWFALESPYEGSFLSAAESDALYIMGLRGNTFRFDEQSQNWEKIPLPQEATINDAIVLNDQIILVGQGGTLLQQNGREFLPLGERQLRSFTALTHAGDTLIITGETGIVRVSLQQEAQ